MSLTVWLKKNWIKKLFLPQDIKVILIYILSQKNIDKYMRVVIQRVKNASVKVNNKIVSKIFFGLLVFVGFSVNDDEKDIDWIAMKILGLRIFNDKNYKMNFSIMDVSGELLIVSQFTLYGDCSKGNRPSFSSAALADKGELFYNNFIIPNKSFFQIY